MATDFRDNTKFPRRGRELSGEAMWLYRVTDKGRAAAAGTIGEYIYPCPMDKGVMQRWGITPEQFDAALASHATDAEMHAWLQEHTTAERIREANAWLLSEKRENLDRQDSEEGVHA